MQVKYQDKDIIVREGAEADTFYIILKGEVRLRPLLKRIRIPLKPTLILPSSYALLLPLRSW